MPDSIPLVTETLPAQLADAAFGVIARVVETHYDHIIKIEPEPGIFDCDCSGFVSFLIDQIAARHLAVIAATTTDKRLLAHDFYNFAASLPTDVQQGWQRVETLQAVRRGDIVAWKLRDSATGGDTGHVFIAAAPAVLVPEDGSHSIEVYDSSQDRHFDDSRGPGKRFKTGIGTGAIHFRTDSDGRPTAFQFHSAAGFHDKPIAIARLAPFSPGS